MHWRSWGARGTKGQWVFTDTAPGWGSADDYDDNQNVRLGFRVSSPGV